MEHFLGGKFCTTFKSCLNNVENIARNWTGQGDRGRHFLFPGMDFLTISFFLLASARPPLTQPRAPRDGVIEDNRRRIESQEGDDKIARGIFQSANSSGEIELCWRKYNRKLIFLPIQLIFRNRIRYNAIVFPFEIIVCEPEK